MSRYIDAEKIPYDYTNERGVPMTREIDIQNVHTADVRPNVHGEWRSTDLIGFKRCSVCRALWHVDITGNLFCYYCPKCGADMRKGEKDGRTNDIS